MILPPEMLTRHTAILGSTGSGKTSVAKCGIVEPTLRAGGRVLVIDPTSAWWGLRLNADGKRQGFPIYIFGGDHGDYPLAAKNAEVLAEAFGTSSDSAVFDTSQMTVSERCSFFTAFAAALMRRNRGPLNLIIDEAHLFMPQAGASVGGQVPSMLHAGNNLVSLGRSKGLRVTMISQRPSKLHKDSLTQAQSMIAMRVLSPQDRRAIAEWIAEQADTEKGKEIVSSLSSLKAGEAWVWAPLQHHLKRTQFPLPTTFDSSKAPDDASGSGPVLSPINMDALKGRLATVEAEAKANDPRELKAEIARLRRELAEAKASAPVDAAAIGVAEAKGFERGKETMLGAIANLASDLAGALERAEEAHASAKRLLCSFGLFISTQAGASPQPPPQAPIGLRAIPSPPVRVTLPSPTSEGALTTPQRKVAEALQFWSSVGERYPSREQVAAIAGYAPGSGNFNNILGGMKTAGWITYPQPGSVSLIAEIGEQIDTSEAARRLASILSGPEAKLVAVLRNGDACTRDDLATAAGFAPGSGHFNNVVGGLSSMKLVQYPSRGIVQLAAWAVGLV